MKMSARRTKKYRTLKRIPDASSSSSCDDCLRYDYDYNNRKGDETDSYGSDHTGSDTGDGDTCENMTLSRSCSMTNIRDQETSIESNQSVSDSEVDYKSVLRSSLSDCQLTSDSSDTAYDIPERKLDLHAKLKRWAVHNIANITNSCITELLHILREQGHSILPKTAETLLGTARRGAKGYTILPMLDHRKGCGEYTYLGIEKQLQKVISPHIFKKDIIRVLVNIDGLPVYRHSLTSMWPILMQVCDDRFEAKPFVVGIYCGTSKPKSPNCFLRDFVQESTILIENGLKIQEKSYQFEILGFVCDTPARSFIKCTKGHCGYYSCERCETKGETRSGINKRIFPETNCTLRTKESFRNKTQPQHHLPNLDSPLLDIPGFDPIKQMLLDYLHLLCIGVMKFNLDKWVNGDKHCRCKIGRDKFLDLMNLLEKCVNPAVPNEFQRKNFDLDDLCNWKATQTRFFLLYVGAVVMRDILPKQQYRHFLLLVVACRLLSDAETAVKEADYAKSLLLKYFEEMPSYYGLYSQGMNMHNLIHVADDVKYLQMPLSMFSTFPFENYLGELKKLVRTPHATLAQVIRRLSEMDSTCSQIIHPIPDVSQCTRLLSDATQTASSTIQVKEIRVRNVFVSTLKPDNIVLLENDDIFEICQIHVTDDNSVVTQLQLSKVFFHGHTIQKLGYLFTKPCLSSAVGILKIGERCSTMKVVGARSIKRKCIKMDICDKSYVITLLHQ